MFFHNSFSPAERGGLMIGLLRLADVCVVIAAGVFAFWMRDNISDLPARYALAIFLGAFGIANAAQAIGLYDIGSLVRVRGQFGRATVAWAAVMTVLIVIAYFTKTSDSFSRLWAVTWFVSVTAALIVCRIIAISRIEQWREEGKLRRRVAVVGTGDKAERIRGLSETVTGRDIVIVGVFSPQEIDALLEKITREQIDEIIIAMPDHAMPGHDDEALARIVGILGTVSVEVSYLPESRELPFPILGVSFVGPLPLFGVHRRPLSIWSRVVKRLEDLILASVILIFAAPLMLVIALMVRLTSPGPVLFRQRRLGFNNNAFTLLKFRTMREAETPEGARDIVPQARKDDPRITPLGRILRRTSLDELPQLFNVLRGEMSLVGPRPHAIAHNREYAQMLDGYLARHRVKPGMTGWAQVNGLRGETDTLDKMRQRIEHDLYYIGHWSLWLDLKILVMTAIFGFVNRNAY